MGDDSLIDKDSVVSEVAGDNSDDLYERVRQRIDKRLNKRTYISDPSEAPEGVDVQEGERGGYYYEDSSGGASEMSERGEAVSHFEDFVEDVDPADAQGPGADPAEQEALQIWSDFTRDEISEEEFEERAEEFIQEYAEDTLG